MLQSGEIFEGRYEIERRLGEGAFAVVYLAREQSLGRPVAIKVLKEGRSDNRFLREAKLLSELRSPHTVMLIEFGRSGRDQRPFMVSEYVPGETLEDRLRRVGPMPGGRVAHIVRQILASLGEAHARGIVHRDVKPANIMLTDVDGDEDFVKVLDFGVAKPLEDVRDVSVELTMAGQIIGTMRYMAPEQLRGDRKAVPASDVYAVGLIAYELLTGEKAASGADAAVVLSQHLSREVFTIPEHLDVPFYFKQAFEAMMAKELALRPRDAGEALRALSVKDDDSTTFDTRLAEENLETELRAALQSGPQQALRRSGEHQALLQPAPPPEESLRIDVQALEENRARVTRGVTTAVPPQAPEEEDTNMLTVLFVALAVVAFGIALLLLTRFA